MEKPAPSCSQEQAFLCYIDSLPILYIAFLFSQMPTNLIVHLFGCVGSFPL